MPFVKKAQFEAAVKSLRRVCKCGPFAVLVLKHTGDVVAIKGSKPHTCLVFSGQENTSGVEVYKNPIEVRSKYLEKDTPRELQWIPAAKVYNIFNRKGGT